MTYNILAAILSFSILFSFSSGCLFSYNCSSEIYSRVFTCSLTSASYRVPLSGSVRGWIMAYSSLGRNLTVVSHNIRGLNIPEKRSTLLRELKKGRPHFAFIQETHFKTNNIPRLTDSYFIEAHHSTNTLTKSKGVSILISKDANFELTDKLADPEGKYLLIKGKHNGIPTTLANIYFPNTSHLTFCRKMMKELEGFYSGRIILGGDFNLPLNPLIDTSSGKSYITYRILKSLKTLLNSLHLIDTWRYVHPEGRDYTYYSAPHARYSRID